MCASAEKRLQIVNFITDHSVDISFVTETWLKIEGCISEVKSWMTSNKLQLKDDKTELVAADQVETYLAPRHHTHTG